MSWPGAVKAYAPKTGELLWACTGLEKDEGPDRLVYTSPLVSAAYPLEQLEQAFAVAARPDTYRVLIALDGGA